MLLKFQIEERLNCATAGWKHSNLPVSARDSADGTLAENELLGYEWWAK